MSGPDPQPFLGPDGAARGSSGPRPEDTETPHPRLRLLGQSVAVGFVLFLLVTLVVSLVRTNDGARYVTKVDQGQRPSAPRFDLPVILRKEQTWPSALRPTIGDGRLSLAELRGQFSVINFWASWCLPCKAEAPAFARAADRYSGQVAFVGIDVQDSAGAARAFLRRYKVNYVSLRDPSNGTYNAYGLTGVPETYFVDRRGRTVAHEIGRVREADLMRLVAELRRGSTRTG